MSIPMSNRTIDAAWIADARKGLERVTPGPWSSDADHCVRAPGRCIARLDWGIRDVVDDANAAHIARFSPDNAAELLKLAGERLASIGLNVEKAGGEAGEVAARLRSIVTEFDNEVADAMNGDSGERADLWTDIDVPVELARSTLSLIEQQAAQIEALKEALEPFVAQFRAIEARYAARGGNLSFVPDEADIGSKPHLTYGDFRRARQTLESSK